MRTVLFAAASTLCLAFAAHGAPLSHRSVSQRGNADVAASNLAQPVSAAPGTHTNCIEPGASLNHVVFSPDALTDSANTTDDDADVASSAYCSQYLSTQMLVQAPLQGHT